MAYEGTSRNAQCPCGSGLKYKKCHNLVVPIPGAESGPGAAGKYGKVVKERNAEYLHIVMPTRGSVCIETMQAVGAFGWHGSDYARLGVNRVTFTPMARKPVAEARELLAEAVIRGIEIQPEVKHYVLWVDDDAFFSLEDIMALLFELRRNPDIGIMSCFYSPKVKNHPGWIPMFGNREDRMLTAGVDFEADNIVEVPWVGLHCAVMRGEILPKLELPMFPCDPITGCGEDVLFSHRIRDAGFKCAVHAGVIVPHIDATTGERFVPNVGAKRVIPLANADAEAGSIEVTA